MDTLTSVRPETSTRKSVVLSAVLTLISRGKPVSNQAVAWETGCTDTEAGRIRADLIKVGKICAADWPLPARDRVIWREIAVAINSLKSAGEVPDSRSIAGLIGLHPFNVSTHRIQMIRAGKITAADWPAKKPWGITPPGPVGARRQSLWLEPNAGITSGRIPEGFADLVLDLLPDAIDDPSISIAAHICRETDAPVWHVLAARRELIERNLIRHEEWPADDEEAEESGDPTPAEIEATCLQISQERDPRREYEHLTASSPHPVMVREVRVSAGAFR